MFTGSDRFHGVGLVAPLSIVDELWRSMGELVDDHARRGGPAGDGVELSDDGDRLVVRVDLPGVAESDIEVTYDDAALSIRASRDTAPPPGWRAHRRERPSFQLARTIRLPLAIDAEQATASLRDGSLEIVLPKVPAAQPRRLPVRAPTSN